MTTQTTQTTQTPSAESPENSLRRILSALKAYPRPVRIVDGTTTTYAPPLYYALDVFSERFSVASTAVAETRIRTAFAEAVPKALRRVRALIIAAVENIADLGGATEGTKTEYAALVDDLSCLATVFAGPPGALADKRGIRADLYARVCDAMMQMRDTI